MDEVELLILDEEIVSLYKLYLDIPVPEGFEIKELEPWIKAIAEGETRGLSLRECVISCIKTAIWMRSTPHEEILRLANDKQLDQHKEALREFYEGRMKHIESGMKSSMENLSKDFSLELNLNDRLKLRMAEIEVERMSLSDLRKLFIDMYRSALIKESAYKEMLKRGWNV